MRATSVAHLGASSFFLFCLLLSLTVSEICRFLLSRHLLRCRSDWFGSTAASRQSTKAAIKASEISDKIHVGQKKKKKKKRAASWNSNYPQISSSGHASQESQRKGFSKQRPRPRCKYKKQRKTKSQENMSNHFLDRCTRLSGSESMNNPRLEMDE